LIGLAQGANAVKKLAIVHFIVAVLCIGLLFLFVQPPVSKTGVRAARALESAIAEEVPPLAFFPLALFLAVVLLIAAGVALLLSATWGRYLTLAYAAVSFTSSLAYALALWYVKRPEGAALSSAMDHEHLGPSHISEVVSFQIPALGVGLAYPLIVGLTLLAIYLWQRETKGSGVDSK
jgi:hypothetical protein